MSLGKQLVALLLTLGGGLLASAGVVAAQTPGVTATEIKIGNINPYSGPASAYGTIGKAIGAYVGGHHPQGRGNRRFQRHPRERLP